MKKKYCSFVYRLLSGISLYWNNRWINKYKIACGIGLLLISGSCQVKTNNPTETTLSAIPENKPVENVDSTSYDPTINPPEIDTDSIPPPPPPIIIELVDCYLIDEGPIITCYDPVYPLPEEDKPDELNEEPEYYVAVEEMPQFPGGDMAMMKYIQENLVYPENAIRNGVEGRVVCQFIIDEEGGLYDIKVVRSIDSDLDEEALRIIESMPTWKPGIQRGKAVKVQYTVPVKFKLPEEKESEE
ncbi:MAG: energy transducer TonB [Tannerellaceae bacterium]|nr:energy transducer TonB [Tannerellaceae bacterium]